MIWFDADKVYLTPNYHVQKLFANNLGSHTLTLDDEAIGLREKGIYVSVSETTDGEVILKAVNTKKEDFVLSLNDENGNGIKKNAKLLTLMSAGPEPDNMPEPSKVEEKSVSVEGSVSLPAMTFSILRF